MLLKVILIYWLSVDLDSSIIIVTLSKAADRLKMKKKIEFVKANVIKDV